MLFLKVVYIIKIICIKLQYAKYVFRFVNNIEINLIRKITNGFRFLITFEIIAR